MSQTVDLNEMVEKLSKLSVLDLAKLKQMLEDTWGVKAAAAAVAVAAGPASAGAAPQAAAEEEASEYNVVITAADESKKIGIIKAVREATGLGLKEAKDIVEGAPKEVKTHVPKAEAQTLKKKLEEAGAKVELKGI